METFSQIDETLFKKKEQLLNKVENIVAKGDGIFSFRYVMFLKVVCFRGRRLFEGNDSLCDMVVMAALLGAHGGEFSVKTDWLVSGYMDQ